MKKKRHQNRPNQWKKKKKKKRTEQPTQEKKKVKSGQKLQLVLFAGPSYVFNYKNVIGLWVMKTENSQNVFSVSITHNSKIRELSDGNRVIETELSFAKQPFCYGSHHFWVLSYGNRELSYGNRQSKRPLRDLIVLLVVKWCHLKWDLLLGGKIFGIKFMVWLKMVR